MGTAKVESGCGNSNPQGSTGVELYRACIDIYALDSSASNN